MDVFDVKRRDNPSMDQWIDPKKPPFGGPNEKAPFDKNKRKSLDKYQRVVTRNADFEGGKENHNYDTTWKAITRDRISRDAKKKPTDVMYAKPTIFTQNVEEGKIFRFEEFVKLNEDFEQQQAQDLNLQTEAEEPIDNEDPVDTGYEVDEEQLEKVMDEYGDELNELIDKICEEMEIEKDAVSDLLCAAIEKICKPEDDDENPDAEAGGEGGDNPAEPPVDEDQGLNQFA